MKTFEVIDRFEDVKGNNDITLINGVVNEFNYRMELLALQVLAERIIKLFNSKEFSNVEKIKLDPSASYDDQGMEINNFWVNVKLKGQSWNEDAKYNGVYRDTPEGKVQSFMDNNLLTNTSTAMTHNWNLLETITRSNYKTALTSAFRYYDEDVIPKDFINNLVNKVKATNEKKLLTDKIPKGDDKQMKLKI